MFMDGSRAFPTLKIGKTMVIALLLPYDDVIALQDALTSGHTSQRGK